MRRNELNCVMAVLTPRPALEVRFSSRDWKLLQEEYLPGSAAFLYEFGFVGITSIAEGLRTGQTVERKREDALAAAEGLWAVLEPQLELLSSDYVCEPEKQRVGGAALVSKRLGNVRAGAVEYSIEMPPGQCRLETAPTIVEEFNADLGRVCIRAIRNAVEDLRFRPTFVSENYGVIRIRKRRRDVAWGTVVPALIDVLRRPDTPDTIRIHNAHR